MADVAHELRTPLTVVQGRLEGLIDGVYPRDDSQLKALLEETRVLSRLVEDLRTLAARRGRRAAPRPGADRPRRARPRCRRRRSNPGGGRGVALASDRRADDGRSAIDPVRIREVLSTCCRTPCGTRRRGTVTHRLVTPPAHGRVSVADTGAGIAAEDLTRIFDRFYKGPASRGSGLGLTIAEPGRSPRRHDPGGEHRQHGTTIVFTLPR